MARVVYYRYAILVVWLTVCAVFLVPVRAEAAVPRDVAGHWSAVDVTRLVVQGVVRVDADRLFRPDQSVTRGELVRMLILGLDLDRDLVVLSRSPRTFRDVGIMHPEREYIEAAAELGIALGYPDGNFLPDNRLTRAEMAAFLVRALGLDARARQYQGRLPFADANIPSWARGYIGVVAELGLVMGYDNRFHPSDPASRAEAATVVARMMERRGNAWTVVGTVRGWIGTGVIRVRGQGEDQVSSIPVHSEAVLFRNQRQTTSGNIRTGDQVFMVLDEQGRARFLMAVWLDQLAELVAVRINPDGVTLRHATGVTTTVGVRSDATLIRHGRRVTLYALQPGDRLYVVYDYLTGQIRAIDAVRVDMTGELLTVNAAQRTIQIRAGDGVLHTLSVAPAAVVTVDGQPSTLAGLARGDRVSALTLQQDQAIYLEVRRDR